MFFACTSDCEDVEVEGRSHPRCLLSLAPPSSISSPSPLLYKDWNGNDGFSGIARLGEWGKGVTSILHSVIWVSLNRPVNEEL